MSSALFLATLLLKICSQGVKLCSMFSLNTAYLGSYNVDDHCNVSWAVNATWA